MNKSCNNIAFAELLSCLKEARKSEQGPATCEDVNVNFTRFKDMLLSHCSFLSASKKGNYVLLALYTDIGDALKRACESDIDAAAINLTKAAQIVGRQIFQENYGYANANA